MFADVVNPEADWFRLELTGRTLSGPLRKLALLADPFLKLKIALHYPVPEEDLAWLAEWVQKVQPGRAAAEYKTGGVLTVSREGESYVVRLSGVFPMYVSPEKVLFNADHWEPLGGLPKGADSCKVNGEKGGTATMKRRGSSWWKKAFLAVGVAALAYWGWEVRRLRREFLSR